MAAFKVTGELLSPLDFYREFINIMYSKMLLALLHIRKNTAQARVIVPTTIKGSNRYSLRFPLPNFQDNFYSGMYAEIFVRDGGGGGGGGNL